MYYCHTPVGSFELVLLEAGGLQTVEQLVLPSSEGEHAVGGDDGAALEEDLGGGGVVQGGHLQHGRVSVHSTPPPCPATCNTNIKTQNNSHHSKYAK